MGRQISEGMLIAGGMSIGQGLARVMSWWWLMPPLTAAYHLGALAAVLTAHIPLIVLVMLAEAGWAGLAAANGRRAGARDRRTIQAASKWGEEQPHLLSEVRGPAGGHAGVLVLCWITAPLQTAAYATGYGQALDGVSTADLRAAHQQATAAKRPAEVKPTPRPKASATTTTATEPPAPAVAPPRPAGAFLGFDPGNGGAVRANPRGACLVIGPPGTGKTQGVIAPSVATAPGPVVSTSIKWDVLAATAAVRRERGTVWAFDPGGGEDDLPEGVKRVHWSPLDSVFDWESALIVAARLRQALPDAHDPGGAHWLDKAQEWAAVLLYAASLSGVEDLMRWSRRPRAATKAIRAVLKDSPGPDTDMARDALAAVVDDTEDRERSSIESTMARLWQVYKLPGGIRTAQGTNFSPEKFADSDADTLYIAVPAERTQVYAPAVVALIEAIRFAQYRRHARLEKSGESSPPMTFVLDEAANTAPIDIPSVCSESGGQRLHLVIALQNLSQARHRWGLEQGAGLLTMVGTKALLPGIVDTNTLEAISVAVGDYERGQVTVSVGDDGRQSTNYGQQQQRSIPPSRIARLQDGAVIVVEGAHPRQITAARWHAETDRIMEAR
ncbi:type IV secretory system conjugative DNA transfer family protein [Mycobacterium sp. 1274756.6]|uniref:type IV secretory system conjugative DNA transfer family protein n=1 Tax=Mycobacterium sp. 1274756.6 TaxID=1834076 RepID=UPI0008010A13|nr:type IV secretory system conjugative DNA transfer family protein [Mycobacterium sp. 1274756.6]OBJ73867.1 hypothetical protein A5643_00320 [Mycobacterium sp. 1274756.6]